MKTRRILIVGLALLLLVALFPPRKLSSDRHPDLVPSRAFYFPGGMDFSYYHPDKNTSYPVEIDQPRMLVEWMIILSSTGILVAIFQTSETGPNQSLRETGPP